MARLARLSVVSLVILLRVVFLGLLLELWGMEHLAHG